MTTKTDITNELNKINGWDVITFNSHHKMPRGALGFIDHIMHHYKGWIIYIEVKLYRDVLSEKQKDREKLYTSMMKNNKKFKYYKMTEKNYLEIIEEIWRL